MPRINVEQARELQRILAKSSERSELKSLIRGATPDTDRESPLLRNISKLLSDYRNSINDETIPFDAENPEWIHGKRLLIEAAETAIRDHGPRSEQAAFQLEGLFHDALLCAGLAEKGPDLDVRLGISVSILQTDFDLLKERLHASRDPSSPETVSANGVTLLMSDEFRYAACRGMAQLESIKPIGESTLGFWAVANDHKARSQLEYALSHPNAEENGNRNPPKLDLASFRLSGSPSPGEPGNLRRPKIPQS